MNNLKSIKNIFILFAVFLLLACNTDDDNSNPTADLIGTWERSDTNSEFNYTLTFNFNDEGWRTVGETNTEDGTFVSSISVFDWDINDTLLTLEYQNNGSIIETNFSFNDNGELLLSKEPDLFFTKIDE